MAGPLSWAYQSGIRRVQVLQGIGVAAPRVLVLAGLELLWAAFKQALVNILPLGQDLNQRVMPFQDGMP